MKIPSSITRSNHPYLLARRFTPLFCVAALLLIVSANPVAAATCTFSGALSTDFNTAGNWSCGFIPGATSTAIIPSATSTALSASVNLSDLIVDTNATLTTTGFDVVVNNSVTTTGSLVAGGGNIITIGKDWLFNSSSSFVAGDGTVLFATSTLGISQNLYSTTTPATLTLNNLSVNTSASSFFLGNTSGSIDSFILNGNFETTGTAVVLEGDATTTGDFFEDLGSSFDYAGHTLSVQGDFTALDTVLPSGTLVINGSSSQNVRNAEAHDFLINKPSGTANLFGGIFTHVVSLLSGSVEQFGVLTLQGSGTPLLLTGGTFHSNQEVAYDATSTTNVASTTYKGLSFLDAATSTVNYLLSASTTALGQIFIGNGSNLSLGSNTLHIGGNWNDSGTFSSNATGTVDFINNSIVLNPESSFPNITLSGSGSTLTLDGDTSVSGNVVVTSTATLSFIGSNTLHVAGDWTDNGTLVPGTGTIDFTGSATSTVGTEPNFFSLTISKSGSAAALVGNVTSTGAVTIAAGATLALGTSTLSNPSTTPMSNAGLITIGVGGRIHHPTDSFHFTDSSGTPKNSYSTPDSIYLTLQDSNRNLNGAALESISEAVTTTAGDSESILLVETGVSTGIFRNTVALPLVTGSSVTPANSQIEITANDVGMAIYADVQDLSDTTSTSAILTLTPPSGQSVNLGGGGLGSASSGLPPVVTHFETSGGVSNQDTALKLQILADLGIPVHALIKLPCQSDAASADPNNICKAVYYIGTDGQRHAFPNSKDYFTWYPDFSRVQNVTATQLSAIQLGHNITYKPGVRMVKFTTDPKVYAVGKGGVLSWVTSETVAKALYGSNWNKDIDDVGDAFYQNYFIDGQINAAGDFNPQAQQTSVSYPSDNFGM